MLLLSNFFRKTYIFFKLVEENIQLNIIKYLKKDQKTVLIGIGSTNSDDVLELSAVDIIKNAPIFKSLAKNDQKLVKAILLAEGDIVLISKNFNQKQELLLLRSLLSGEEWNITQGALATNNEIKDRLNIKCSFQIYGGL